MKLRPVSPKFKEMLSLLSAHFEEAYSPGLNKEEGNFP
jgi:hypothetical protein